MGINQENVVHIGSSCSERLDWIMLSRLYFATSIKKVTLIYNGIMKSYIEIDSSGKKSAINVCTEPCAIEKGMRLIGGKWKGSIIYHLKDKPVRFNDLVRMLGGASKRMVDQRLKELEKEGMVIRKVICERPIAVTYELTEFGRSALNILDDLRAWSEKNNV